MGDRGLYESMMIILKYKYQSNQYSRLKGGALHLARFWWGNLAEKEKRAKACLEPGEGLTKKAQNLIEMRQTWTLTNHSKSLISRHMIANKEAVVLFWELEKRVKQFPII